MSQVPFEASFSFFFSCFIAWSFTEIYSTKARGQTALEQHLRLTGARERSNLVDTVDAYMRRMRSPDDMDVSLVRCNGKDECTVCGAKEYQKQTDGQQARDSK